MKTIKNYEEQFINNLTDEITDKFFELNYQLLTQLKNEEYELAATTRDMLEVYVVDAISLLNLATGIASDILERSLRSENDYIHNGIELNYQEITNNLNKNNENK